MNTDSAPLEGLQEDTTKNRYLTFNIDSEVYGIEIAYVKEIIEMVPITHGVMGTISIISLTYAISIPYTSESILKVKYRFFVVSSCKPSSGALSVFIFFSPFAYQSFHLSKNPATSMI